jgi:hypothetical protein
MMRGFSRQPSRTQLGVLLSAAWCIASGTALAQVPVTGYVVVQPIDVCQDTGWSNTTGSCAPFNTSDSNPNPAKTTSSTTIGFVDSATGKNITREIWRQAGIDIVFQPLVTPTGSVFQYNSSISQNIQDFDCSTGTCNSPTFKNLSSGLPPPNAPKGSKGPTLSSDPTTINMFFVNGLTGILNTGVSVPLFGFGWIGANGIVINSGNVFSTPGRVDNLAHELGHNLGLDHATCGAGPSSTCPGQVVIKKPPLTCAAEVYPGGCNLLDSGSFRIVTADTSTAPCAGELYMLPLGRADRLTLGTTGTQPNCTFKSQQDAAVHSVFFNPSTSIPSSAGGGDVEITVSYPTGSKKNPNGPPGGYIAALVLQLPLGTQFGANLFTQTGGTAVPVGVQQLNGNQGGGNSNCIAVINKTSTVQCLEIDFPAPGQQPPGAPFTANTSISFTTDIVFKGNVPGHTAGQTATMADLGCTTPSPQSCLDLTYVFNTLVATTSFFGPADKNGNSTTDAQLPDDTVPAVIVDPHNFPTLDPNATFVGFNGPALTTLCMTNPSSPSCPSGAQGSVPIATQPYGD